MTHAIASIQDLQNKSFGIIRDFENLPDKDIRRKHLEILHTQITTSLLKLIFINRFSETNKTEFESPFNSDPSMIESYIYSLTQNSLENIIDAALFQTELVFRFYYSKLTGMVLNKEKKSK